MYVSFVLLTMLVLPVLSCFISVAFFDAALLSSFGTWFVFWALGVRLFIAGLRQVFQPSFTAKQIFEIEDPRAEVVVRELGFANISFGAVGLISLWVPSWVFPASLLGLLFFGMAGFKHVFEKRNATENIAMVSDLWAFLVFGTTFVLLHWGHL